jgi:hypothetical protein
MLFDNFSGKKCISGKVICAFFCPAVLLYIAICYVCFLKQKKLFATAFDYDEMDILGIYF